jgi:hypothetical protein
MDRRQFFRLAAVAGAALATAGTATEAAAQLHRPPARHVGGPRMAPPAKRLEHRPPPPHATGYQWSGGDWRWNGARYNWTPGRWIRRRPGQRWVPGAWRQQNGAWIYIDGRWY